MTISVDNTNIISSQVKTLPNNIVVCTFNVRIRDLKHLQNMMDKLENVAGVQKVERI